jgi:hypothetical protein
MPVSDRVSVRVHPETLERTRIANWPWVIVAH